MDVNSARDNSETPAANSASSFKCQKDGFFSKGVGKSCSSDYVSCVSGIAYHRVGFIRELWKNFELM